MIEKALRYITSYIGIALFLVAIFIVHHELKLHAIAEISISLKQIPVWIIIFGLFLTGINYISFIGYDFLAVRYLGKTIPLKQLATASLLSFAVSNNTGQALISGTSMRYRFYSLWGFTGLDIIKMSLFISLMYVLGATTLFVISNVTLTNITVMSYSMNHMVR